MSVMVVRMLKNLVFVEDKYNRGIRAEFEVNGLEFSLFFTKTGKSFSVQVIANDKKSYKVSKSKFEDLPKVITELYNATHGIIEIEKEKLTKCLNEAINEIINKPNLLDLLNATEKPEKTEKQVFDKTKAIEFGKLPNLIPTLLSVAQSLPEPHIGDSEAILAILHHLNGEGEIIIIGGESSAGKSSLVNSVLKLFPEDRIEDIGFSDPQALKHWLKQVENQDFDILYIRELKGAESVLQHIKLMSSYDDGFIVLLTEKDEQGNWTANKYKIPCKNIITTTTAIKIDKELDTRALRISVDESEELTRKVVFYKLDSDKEPESGKKPNPNYELAKAFIATLAKKPVICPWTDVLKEAFPEDFYKKTRARRDIDKIRSLYRYSAILHQYQRPIVKINGVEHIVALPQDLFNAIVIGQQILRVSIYGLDKRIQTALNVRKEIQKEHSVITKNHLAQKLNCGKTKAYNLLKELENLGFLDLKGFGKNKQAIIT